MKPEFVEKIKQWSIDEYKKIEDCDTVESILAALNDMAKDWEKKILLENEQKYHSDNEENRVRDLAKQCSSLIVEYMETHMLIMVFLLLKTI